MNKMDAVINGRMYTLITDEDKEYMNKVITTVNDHIDEVKKKRNSFYGERAVVLAALNICDMYLKAESGGKVLMDNFEKKYEEIISENKKLNEIISQSDYEIDICSLRAQLECAQNEIESLKSEIKKIKNTEE